MSEQALFDKINRHAEAVAIVDRIYKDLGIAEKLAAIDAAQAKK